MYQISCLTVESAGCMGIMLYAGIVDFSELFLPAFPKILYLNYGMLLSITILLVAPTA